MLARKPTKETKHRRYSCKVCGKEDRKGRLLGHVLKYHVPMDRVPYSCSLCNFRCTDRTTLVHHINNYQRHKEEALRSGVPNLANVLNRSENPIDVNTYIYAVDEAFSYPIADLDSIELDSSIFDPQDAEEPTLPDWLADFEVPPPVVTPKPTTQVQTPFNHVYGVFSHSSGMQSSSVPEMTLSAPSSRHMGHNTPVLPSTANFHRLSPRVAESQVTPMASPQVTSSLYRYPTEPLRLLPLVRTTANLPRSSPRVSAPQLTPVVSPFVMSSLPGFSTEPLRVPSVTTAVSGTCNPVLSFGSQLDMPSLNCMPSLLKPNQQVISSTPAKATPSGFQPKGTPLQDEAVYLLKDLLDGAYQSDPLFQEGERVQLDKSITKEAPKTAPSATSVKEGPPKTAPSTTSVREGPCKTAPGVTSATEGATKTAPIVKSKRDVAPTTAPSVTQTRSRESHKPERSEDQRLGAILLAIEANGRELHTVNRNLRSAITEMQNLHGAVMSLERTCARRPFPVHTPAPRGRSRTPLFQLYNRKRNTPSGKENSNLKSTVKKVKKN